MTNKNFTEIKELNEFFKDLLSNINIDKRSKQTETEEKYANSDTETYNQSDEYIAVLADGSSHICRYLGSLEGYLIVQLQDGSVTNAHNIRKIKEYTLSEAKNKISNLLETQVNPKTIQKVLEIIENIKN